MAGTPPRTREARVPLPDDRRWPRRGAALPLVLLLLVGVLGAGFRPLPGAADGNRIVGGAPVASGALPFMAAIYIRNDAGGNYFCGGALVDPRFVLTAAHCVADDSGGVFPADRFRVVVGFVDLRKATSEDSRRVVAVAQHPAFDDRTDWNDVAVLTLAEPVPEDVATPVTLIGPGDGRYDQPGQSAVAAGWGRTSGAGPSSPVLLGARLGLVAGSACNRTFGEFKEALQLCAKAATQATCLGDSGAPLVIPSRASVLPLGAADHRRGKDRARSAHADGPRAHRHRRDRAASPPPLPEAITQIGVLSFGASGCPTNRPEGYTRLSDPGVRAFIAGVVGH